VPCVVCGQADRRAAVKGKKDFDYYGLCMAIRLIDYVFWWDP